VLECAVHRAPDGDLAQADALADLALRQLVDEAQSQDRALPIGEAGGQCVEVHAPLGALVAMLLEATL
jgi:hypothetical protein